MSKPWAGTPFQAEYYRLHGEIERLMRERDFEASRFRAMEESHTKACIEGDALAARAGQLESSLHALATGLRWEEELRAWVLSDLGALTRARQALAPRCERCGNAGYVTMFDDNSRAPCPSCAGAGVTR